MTTHIDTLDPQQVVSSIDAMRQSDHGRFYIDQVAGGDERFALYLLLIDKKMRLLLGVTHRDTEDAPWRAMYDDGMCPADAIREALSRDDLYRAILPVLDQLP